jgi:hypothetical protein
MHFGVCCLVSDLVCLAVLVMRIGGCASVDLFSNVVNRS